MEAVQEHPSDGAPARHKVPVRRPGLSFDRVPRAWLGGNVFATHMFNGLNFLFPEGERFFIKAVKDRLDRIDDKDLARQARGFFGQEAQHAVEHEHYFDWLEAQGYEIQTFLRRFKFYVGLSNRILPASLRLSITAAAEHYTATIGAAALVDDKLREIDPTMQQLIVWHACEEVEHKAVAFDVLQATHPSYLLRIIGFFFATATIVGWSAYGTHTLMRQEKMSPSARRKSRKDFDGAQNRDLERHIRHTLLRYFRRDFHPNDIDDLDLARTRLAEVGVAA